MIHRDRFITGMSNAACTVSVVTTSGPNGRVGVTVSAMCSVSADPPSLLVCVHHMSPACREIRSNSHFCVNVLRDNQAYISDTFAGRLETSDGDKFSCTKWKTIITGSPAIDDALVVFDCRLKKDFQWGSHYIFIGDVVALDSKQGGQPLIYTNRAYGSPYQHEPVHEKKKC